MNTLQMIQAVQAELRLPVSLAINDAHSRLILSYLNKVQRSLLMETMDWNELRFYNHFNTLAGTEFYDLPTPGVEADVVRVLQIEQNSPLQLVTDEKFRLAKRLNVTQSMPLMFRVNSRVGGQIRVELCPTPDKIYRIDFEILRKPPYLSLQTDVPMLDPDTIVLGAIVMAKQDQGTDYQLDMSTFQAKLSLQTETQGQSNWGDVEAV